MRFDFKKEDIPMYILLLIVGLAMGVNINVNYEYERVQSECNNFLLGEGHDPLYAIENITPITFFEDYEPSYLND